MRVTGGFAVVGAVALAVSLGAPVLLDKVAIVLIPSGFVIAMVGVAYLTALTFVLGDRTRVTRALMTAPSTSLNSLLAAAGLVAIVAGGLGLFRTDGYSADTHPREDCPWTISMFRNGASVLCVSHHRWLEVNVGVEMGLLGLMVVVNAVACVLFSADPALRPAPASSPE